MTLPQDLRQRLNVLNYKKITSGSTTFDYIEAGQGETILLLHGIGSGAASWLYQFETLGQQYRVIAWNAPGYGDTTPLTNDQPIAADYARALYTFCESTAIASAHLVGQSLGAIMAAAYSHIYPAKVKSLTLLNPARGHGKADPVQREKMRQGRLQGMAKLGPEKNADARAPTQLSPNPSPEALALVRWNLAQLNPAGYAQAVYLLAFAHLPADATYSGAVQVLSGTADGIVPTAQARETAQAYPQHQFHTLEGLGHAAYAEGPDTVNEYLLRFIQNVAANQDA